MFADNAVAAATKQLHDCRLELESRVECGICLTLMCILAYLITTMFALEMCGLSCSIAWSVFHYTWQI